MQPELVDAAHPSWLGLGWGLEAGLRGRQVGLWAQLLRETHARGLLQPEAVCRLEAIGFRWSAQVLSNLLPAILLLLMQVVVVAPMLAEAGCGNALA